MLSRPIAELVEAFEKTTLPRDEWTHEAHLATALWFCLTHCNKERVLEQMREKIQRYNEATGIINGPLSGYHETLTVFWVHHVTAFVNEQSKSGPQSIEELFPLLWKRWGDSRAPLRFYSKRLLMNPTARARFIEPDLAPFAE